MSRKEQSDSKKSKQLNRRSFVKLLPAAGVGGIAAARDRQPRIVKTKTAAAPQNRVTKEDLEGAEKIIGIELTEAQETMALSGVNRNVAHFETLRKIEIPLDTDLPILFHPVLAPVSPPSTQVRTSEERGPSRGQFRIGRRRIPKHKSVDEVAFYSAIDLSRLIRSRKVSSVDLTNMYIDRLKRFGPKLNCTITLTEDLAMRQAEAADREIRNGTYRGVLHGIPWGAKDLFATKDYPTTWGAEPYRNQHIDYDATVIERLQEAGAVLIAKLSLGSLAMGGLWYGGMTHNPWKPDETSSGSSAGSAAATSAGLVGFSLGTETLGSIVSPSSRCGVAGLRPTFGRVSRYGAMTLTWTMDKIGPICRSVEDCAAVLYAIYGPDGRDLAVADAPFIWRKKALSKMRIGYVKEEFDQGNDERKKMHQEALDALRSCGANLAPIKLPKFDTQSVLILLNTEAAAAFDDLTLTGGVDRLTGQGAGDWPNAFRTARFVPAVEYIRAQRARTLLMRKMNELMSEWDAFVTPAPTSASLSITNLTGHPAVVVPCGFIDDHPQAIMFTGRLYDEVTPLQIALAYERTTKWHTMNPSAGERVSK